MMHQNSVVNANPHKQISKSIFSFDKISIQIKNQAEDKTNESFCTEFPYFPNTWVKRRIGTKTTWTIRVSQWI